MATITEDPRTTPKQEHRVHAQYIDGSLVLYHAGRRLGQQEADQRDMTILHVLNTLASSQISLAQRRSPEGTSDQRAPELLPAQPRPATCDSTQSWSTSLGKFFRTNPSASAQQEHRTTSAVQLWGKSIEWTMANKRNGCRNLPAGTPWRQKPDELTEQGHFACSSCAVQHLPFRRPHSKFS